MGAPKTDPSSTRVNFTLNEDKNKSERRKKDNNPFRVVNDGNDKAETSQKRARSNRFFYKVSNHHELFKIGRSFYEDYLSGVKSFAISSTGYQTSQQKTILGLASFFDHKDDFKIAIISDNLDQGAFKDIVSISKIIPSDFFSDKYNINIKSFYNHFDFLNLNELLKLSVDHELGEYDSVFDHVVDHYDIVFWDVPELHKVQMDSERYFPMIMQYESISIIVSKQITKQSDVDELKQFFLSYGINMKGLLFEEKNALEETNKKPISKGKKVVTRKKWWQRIFN